MISQIHAALNLDERFQEEVYTENLDAVDLSEDLLKERRDSVLQEYRHKRLDVIVLVGPDPIRIFGELSKTTYPDLSDCVLLRAVPGQVDLTEYRFLIYRIVVRVGSRKNRGCRSSFAAANASVVRDRGPVRIRSRG